jgi:hypothetical protein
MAFSPTLTMRLSTAHPMLNSDLSLSTLGTGNQLLLAHFCKPVYGLAEKQDCETKAMVVGGYPD